MSNTVADLRPALSPLRPYEVVAKEIVEKQRQECASSHPSRPLRCNLRKNHIGSHEHRGSDREYRWES